MVEKIDPSEFTEKVLNSPKPVLVDFYATWCGPCVKMGPILEDVASEMGDRIKVVKMDIDEISRKTPEAALFMKTAAVRSIPTLVLVNKGEVIGRFVGLQPRNEILTWLKNTLPLAASKPTPGAPPAPSM